MCYCWWKASLSASRETQSHISLLPCTVEVIVNGPVVFAHQQGLETGVGDGPDGGVGGETQLPLPVIRLVQGGGLLAPVVQKPAVLPPPHPVVRVELAAGAESAQRDHQVVVQRVGKPAASARRPVPVGLEKYKYRSVQELHISCNLFRYY